MIKHHTNVLTVFVYNVIFFDLTNGFHCHCSPLAIQPFRTSPPTVFHIRAKAKSGSHPSVLAFPRPKSFPRAENARRTAGSDQSSRTLANWEFGDTVQIFHRDHTPAWNPTTLRPARLD